MQAQLLLLLACSIGAAANAAEPEVATAWLEPPMDVERRNATERMLRTDFPNAKTLWESHKGKDVSYVLTQDQGLHFPGPCDEVPVRVTVRHGQVTSAVYDKSAGTCVKGAPAVPPQYLWDVYAPTQLFQLVEKLGAPSKSSRAYGCLLAVFDESTGIPTTLDAGCPTHIDGYWLINVSEIELRE